MPDQPLIHAVDIGYSNTKIATGRIGARPTPRVFPSGAGPEQNATSSLGGEQLGGMRVQLPGTDQCYVSLVDPCRFNGVPRVTHQFYPETEPYMALALGSLVHANTHHIDLLVTGLPVDQFADAERRRALCARLTGKFALPGGRSVRIARTEVIPQPVGAYVSASVLAADMSAFHESTTLVVDPGWFSFDWCLIRRRELVRDVSGTSTHATSRLLGEVALQFNKTHNANVSAEHFERAIRRGATRISHRGEWVEFDAELEAAIEGTAGRAWSDLLSGARDSAHTADVVVLAGGGAGFHRRFAAQYFPLASIVELPDPVCANVLGYWGWGCGNYQKLGGR